MTDVGYYIPLTIFNTGYHDCQIRFGTASTTDQCAILKFTENVDTGNSVSLGLYGNDYILHVFKDSINLNKPTTINSNLTVTGKVTSNGSNTITHYAPIETGQEISSFKPVFLSGHVYKRVDDE